LEWEDTREAIDHNAVKDKVRREADDVEYEELQKAKKAKEASVDEVANKLDDSKAWWD
jgi:hypothetical protein